MPQNVVPQRGLFAQARLCLQLGALTFCTCTHRAIGSRLGFSVFELAIRALVSASAASSPASQSKCGRRVLVGRVLPIRSGAMIAGTLGF